MLLNRGIQPAAYTREVRKCFLQQLKPLAQYLAAGVQGEPGDVPARPRQTGDKPGTDRIGNVGHDDRDGRGRLHGRNRTRIDPGDDNVHGEPDQVRSKRGQPFQLSVSGAVLDDDILANAVAEAPQALFDRIDEMERLLSGSDRQVSDPVDSPCWLLRVRGERPRNRCPAESQDELAPLHGPPRWTGLIQCRA